MNTEIETTNKKVKDTDLHRWNFANKCDTVLVFKDYSETNDSEILSVCELLDSKLCFLCYFTNNVVIITNPDKVQFKHNSESVLTARYLRPERELYSNFLHFKF